MYICWKLNNGTKVGGQISDDWLDLHIWFELAGYTVDDEQVARHTTQLYFECHVTVEPVYGRRLDELHDVALVFDFRTADLLMRKRLEDTPERSQFDTFLTARSTDYAALYKSMHHLLARLKSEGFQVWRFKIENTLLDVRMPRA
jgi:hypothetical protein